MELLLVFIGLFIFCAVISNKDLTKKKENQEKLGFMTMVILLFILTGLGFLFPSSQSIFPSYSFIIPFLAFTAAVTITSRAGPAKVISRIAWLAILVFIFLVSYIP